MLGARAIWNIWLAAQWKIHFHIPAQRLNELRGIVLIGFVFTSLHFKRVASSVYSRKTRQTNLLALEKKVSVSPKQRCSAGLQTPRIHSAVSVRLM